MYVLLLENLVKKECDAINELLDYLDQYANLPDELNLMHHSCS